MQYLLENIIIHQWFTGEYAVYAVSVASTENPTIRRWLPDYTVGDYYLEKEQNTETYRLIVSDVKYV